jgi:hypothetical protein
MYKIHNKEFKSKSDIKTFLIDAIKSSNGEPITGDEFNIISECIMYVPNFREKKGEITKIVGVKVSEINETYKFNFNIHRLKYRAKHTYEDKKDYTYVGTLVEFIPPVKESTINYVFKFGKYKGMNIEDVDDINYLHWITSGESNLNKIDKGHITKYLKYGFIPYNKNY